MFLLIVEDQPYIKNQIKEEAQGLKKFTEIHEAASIKEAFEVIHNKKVDIISLDLGLPDGNGMQILTHLRDKNIKKCVLVFSVNSELEKTVLRLGAHRFFDKANGIEPLIETLELIKDPSQCEKRSA